MQNDRLDLFKYDKKEITDINVSFTNLDLSTQDRVSKLENMI